MRRPLALIGLSLLAMACQAQIKDPVRLEAGLVSGGETTPSGVRVFRGLPFAAPPVGENRWREPQPAPHWDGVRDASRFGNVCIQNAMPGYVNIAAMDGSPPMSEDCLYLNVWTPAKKASDKLPVMVFFYGGAFTDGGGAPPLYDGTHLAERGAVVVTMNYRLGAFGFFAHPALTADSPHKTSGNYGIMDMVASLQWVHDNIAALGGDPGNVTVFGQSAGAMAIASLITSPRTKGLFQRAISESIVNGGITPNGPQATLAAVEQQGAGAAEAIGVSTAEELRALPADEAAKLGRPTMIVDNWVIPEDPAKVYLEGRENKVDVLMGANGHEFGFVAGGRGGGRGGARGGGRGGRGGPPGGRGGPPGGRGGPVGQGGPGAGAAAAAATPAFDMNAVQMFFTARRIAEYEREQGKSGYIYWFTQASPAAEGSPPNQAVHASEVKYVFDNLGELPLYPDTSDPKLAAASADDQKVADMTASYWVNFARSGDPNGKGLPKWPKHTGLDNLNAIIIDADPGSEELPPLEMLQPMDERLDQQLEPLR